MKISQTTIYQTVEDRDDPERIETFGPFKCIRNDAWLGHGYYFWDSFIELGHWWGKISRKGNYVITEAFYVNTEEKVWDLHGNGNHLKEFQEILNEVLDRKIGTKDNVLVSHIIAFFIKKGTFNYKAIRALGKSQGNVFWDKRFVHVLKFAKTGQETLDLFPPVQICFIDKSALILRDYRIVYPDNYIIDTYA